MRSVRPQNFERRQVPRFGEKGMVAVLLKCDAPFEHRGAYTQRVYVWNERWPVTWPKWIDRRDLPGLIKAVGIGNLEGVEIGEIRAKQAEKATAREKKPKAGKEEKEEKARTPEPEEVEAKAEKAEKDDGGESK